MATDSSAGPQEPSAPLWRRLVRADSSARPQEPSAPSTVRTVPGAEVKKKTAAKDTNSTQLFSHLPQYKKVVAQTLLTHPDVGNMHPAMLQLGLRYADGSISGANASFLVECRPLSISMGNAIKFLKLKISQIDPSIPEDDAKESLIKDVGEFIHSRVTYAAKQLVDSAVVKINSGDVVLTYAYSHVVAETLLEANRLGLKFRVIVMDSRPELEGRHMLSKLLAAGIPCSYSFINALSYSIQEVFLGAGAVMSNGSVVGRAGSAAIAMMAQQSNKPQSNKPVLICCESYKFHERVLLDSITFNELGDPEAVARVAGSASAGLEGWKEHPRLGLLNLKYDTMPAEYVTMIVTEFGMIPPSSVPVILREYRQES
eukprot:gene31984-33910_t